MDRDALLEGEVVDDGESLQRLAIGFLGIADVLELDGLLDHAPEFDEVKRRCSGGRRADHRRVLTS